MSRPAALIARLRASAAAPASPTWSDESSRTLFEGFCGYGLPDDALSGTGLRIATAIVLSIPVIGTWTYLSLFGGEFPGTEIIPRLYIIHVLLLPGILLALIGVHVGLVWYQKHTQFPGPGRTERGGAR